MADTIPGILNARLLYLADEHRDHVRLAAGAMPRAAVSRQMLLSAARTLLGQVPDSDLRVQDVYALERTVALLMLALKPDRGPSGSERSGSGDSGEPRGLGLQPKRPGDFSGEGFASQNVVHAVPREESVDFQGTYPLSSGDRDCDGA